MVMNWLVRHKPLLIAFSITSAIFLFVTIFQVNLLFNNLEGLKHYTETGTITSEMYQYGIVGLINLIVGFVWVVMFLILLWRVIFPDYKTVKNAFFLGELEFITKMPTSIRKELPKK